MSTQSSLRNRSFPTDAPTQVPGVSSIRRNFERRLRQVSNQDRTRISEQGGKFGWDGETQGGAVHAFFTRLEDGGLYANVYVPGAKESSALEAHYFARTNPSGVGVLRKLSASPKNFPRHKPGTKRTGHMREPASCPTIAEPSPAADAAAAPTVQIDVLVVHTAEANKTAHGRLAADVRTAIEHCNTATKNSKAPNITFNLVGPAIVGKIPGLQLVNYREDDSNENAINWLSAENNDSIRQLRNIYAADIVMLVVGGNADNCGVANAFAHAEKAFGVAIIDASLVARVQTLPTSEFEAPSETILRQTIRSLR